MDRLIESFIETLRQTGAMYNRLLAAIEREKKAALASDIEQLTAAGTEKQTVLAQLFELDCKRTQHLHRLARALELPVDGVTLSDLAAAVDAPYKRQLDDIHAQMKRVMEQVQRSNEECRMLIRHCLRLVQNALGFFQHWMESASVYGASGDLCKSQRGGGRLLSGCV